MAPFKNILVAVDFSAATPRCVQLALDLAQVSAGSVVLLHVREPLIASDGQVLTPARIEAAPGFDLRLEALHAELARERGVEVSTRCPIGRAATEIIASAAELHADLIVMGTHGRTGFTHLILGSVAETVVRKAPCPVLTLRVPEPARAPAAAEG